MTAIPPGSAGTSTFGLDVGALLARTDVEAAIGSLTAPPARVDLPLMTNVVSACIYTSSDSSLAIALAPAGTTKADFDRLMGTLPGVRSVSGIGESAFLMTIAAPSGMAGAATIFVIKGQQYFTIQASSTGKNSETLATSITELAKKASSRID